MDFQNENLIARYNDGDGEVIGSVPDLITLVEQDSGEPLSTETVKYGCRIAILLLPAPESMATPQALASVGPQAFGYEHQYDARSMPRPPLQSVWDVFYK